MINKVILVGRLGKDPERRNTKGGTTVATFSVATDRRSNGEKLTDWHNVVAWDKTAEFVVQYLAKGRQVYVEGRLQTRSYEDKDGVKRYATEVVAFTVQALGDKPDGQRGGGSSKPKPSTDEWNSEGAADPADDDIPF